MSDNRIYVGNLPPDCRNKDLEDIFYKYGRIRYVDIKNKRGPPFAFIEFDDPLDAEDSVRGRDGYNFDGYRLKVEHQKGSRNGPRGGFSGRSGPPTRRSDYRVIVSGLPPTGSWQDIKDHMRVAGNVCYADVFKDGTGVCEFIRYDDMKYAVKHLDDTKFKSHEGETSYINVKSDYTKRRSSSRSNSRSRSRSRSASTRRTTSRRGTGGNERDSPSYSPARRSRSRSNSRINRRLKRSYTRSKSRSRSRSPVNRSSRRNRSDSRSRSRSLSPKRMRTHTRSRSRSISRSKSRSRSRSMSRPSETVNGVSNGLENGNGHENGHENGLTNGNNEKVNGTENEEGSVSYSEYHDENADKE